jgi:radical SAM superfamily enzyme YgiQ (UPF0313 family)
MVRSVRNFAAWAKRVTPRAKIVVGGPHPTFVPELAREPGIDFAVRGEAEVALPALVNALAAGETDLSAVPNLSWSDPDGGWQETPLAPVVADLDSLPFPDWTPFFARGWLAAFYRRAFTAITSRGCPYRCTYCVNEKLRKLYAGQRLLRRRSVAHVMAEIDQARARYGVRSLRYEDDDFLVDSSFVAELADAHARGRGVPFSCNVVARQVNETNAADLKRAGCFQISMGLESGDPYIRAEIMGKAVDEADLHRAAEIFRRQGIFVQTYNIFSAPEETLPAAMRTWRLNQELRPDFAWCSLFQVYPGTPIHERLTAQGVPLAADYPESYFQASRLRSPEIRSIVALQRLTQVTLRWRLPATWVERLARVGDNALYRLVFWLSFFAGQVRGKRLSWPAALRFSWRNRPRPWTPPGA